MSEACAVVVVCSGGVHHLLTDQPIPEWEAELLLDADLDCGPHCAIRPPVRPVDGGNP